MVGAFFTIFFAVVLVGRATFGGGITLAFAMGGRVVSVGKIASDATIDSEGLAFQGRIAF